jgi:hypothetical protein
MRKRFKQLKELVKAIKVDPYTSCSSTREEVQAGVFLAQLLNQQEVYGEADVTEQTGYSFKWYDGPYSSSLEEDHCDLVDYLRFESATNGDPIEDDLPLVDCAKQVMEAMDAPDDCERTTWLRFLAIVAYLRVGANWPPERACEEAADAMGPAIDTGRYFQQAEQQLTEAGLGVPVHA